MSKLVQRIGLEKSAVQHLANTLQMDGMRDMTPHRHRFRPSHAWLQMASAFFCFNLLVRLAMPKLVELSHRLDGTVNLVELSGDHIMYVSRVPGVGGSLRRLWWGGGLLRWARTRGGRSCPECRLINGCP
ncbi:MAG: hypothetical protein L0G27_03920 [Paracoccus sp. (in: a-proteobacteria)]|nr:hypothetical protein [Paracoccus sp. (in: a-proteobacteria)]